MKRQDVPEPIRLQGPYRAVRGIIAFLLRVLARVEISGRENLPDRGPFIMVANHIHWLDSPVLMVTLPYQARVFAGEKWAKHWLIGPLLRWLDAIFVNRGQVDRRALREALATLERGGLLGMAPEGTRSKTGGLQQGRTGAAYLAYHAQVKLVPIVSSGQENVVRSWFRLRRARVRVVVGPPIDPPPKGEGRMSIAQLEAFTEEIMIRLAAMLPPQYRGVYADSVGQRPDITAAYSQLVTHEHR